MEPLPAAATTSRRRRTRSQRVSRVVGIPDDRDHVEAHHADAGAATRCTCGGASASSPGAGSSATAVDTEIGNGLRERLRKRSAALLLTTLASASASSASPISAPCSARNVGRSAVQDHQAEQLTTLVRAHRVGRRVRREVRPDSPSESINASKSSTEIDSSSTVAASSAADAGCRTVPARRGRRQRRAQGRAGWRHGDDSRPRTYRSGVIGEDLRRDQLAQERDQEAGEAAFGRRSPSAGSAGRAAGGRASTSRRGRGDAAGSPG